MAGVGFRLVLLAFLVTIVTLMTSASAQQQYEGYIYSPKKLKDPMRAKGDDRSLVPQTEVDDDEEEYITDSLIAASNSINAKLAAPSDVKKEYHGPDLVAAGDGGGVKEGKEENSKQRRLQSGRKKDKEDKMTEKKKKDSSSEQQEEMRSEKKEKAEHGDRVTQAKGVKLADKFRELQRDHEKHSDVKNEAEEKHKNYIKIYHRETSARIKKLATPEDEKLLEEQLAEAESKQMDSSPSENKAQVETPAASPSEAVTAGPGAAGKSAEEKPASDPKNKGNFLQQLRSHLKVGNRNGNAELGKGKAETREGDAEIGKENTEILKENTDIGKGDAEIGNGNGGNGKGKGKKNRMTRRKRRKNNQNNKQDGKARNKLNGGNKKENRHRQSGGGNGRRRRRKHKNGNGNGNGKRPRNRAQRKPQPSQPEPKEDLPAK